MVSKISYFILFEIVILAKGNPANRQGSDHHELQYGLKKLLEDIMKQGNYDVMLNHHEDQPGRHHEDITHITYNSGKPNTRYNKETYRTAESYRGANGKNVQYNSRPNYANTQNYNLYLRKKPNTVENNIHLEETKDRPQIRSETDNIDDVLEFLNDLDKTMQIKGNKDLELRCSGYRCGESRYESDNSDREAFYVPDKYFNRNILNDNYDRHLRCNGRSCSLDRDDDRNDGGSLRCYGNRCSRKANDRDDVDDNDNIYNAGDSDFSNILRCAGENCGLNRDDDNDDDRVGIDDSLRCVGDRCGLNRYDDDDNDDRVGIDDSLRCVGDSCGLNRYDDDDNDDRVGIDDSLRCIGDGCGFNRDDDDNDDDRVGIDSLRCVGDSCGLNRNDDDDDRGRIDSLRCVGDSCGINRNDDDRDGIESLHCVGDTCSFNRNDDDDDTDDTNSFRCVGDRCGRNRKDDEYRNNNAYWNTLNPEKRNDDLRCDGDRCGRSRDDDERDNLRCIGNRCGRSRNDDDDQGSNRKYEDGDEVENILNAYLSRAFDNSVQEKVSPGDKRRLMQEVKKLIYTLNAKLYSATHPSGRYPPNQVNL